MGHDPFAVPRVIVATVALGRASSLDDAAQIAADQLRSAKFVVVRTVTVNREKQYIQQLVTHLSTDNDADALILLGGVGLGPRDFTCEAVDEVSERRIEGFGDAYRRLLQDDLGFGVRAMLARATAGVCNKFVVFALPRQAQPLRLAMETLVIPTLGELVLLAAGRPLSQIPPPPDTL